MNKERKFKADSLPCAYVDGPVLYVAMGIEYIRSQVEDETKGITLEWNADQAYAMEVCDELEAELGDDGTTLIHVMLDDAIKRTIENGCCYVKLPGDEE